MKKNLILHLWLGKAKLVWLPVTVLLLSASVFSVPIAIAQSVPGFIDEDCEVGTAPSFGTTYEVRWSQECPSHRFKGVARYIKFSVSERLRYRIATDSGSPNFITLYDASGDILKGSSPEVDGLFTFKHSSEVIAELNPGTYYVEVVIHSEEVPFDRVPFEFSISVLVIPDDRFRPIQGAVSITSRDGTCTLGFAATIRLAAEEIKGVVTNSHCTNVRGRLDDTQLSQGGELITKRLMGERADSNLLNWNSPASAFETPLDRLICSTNCQYSDAALFELEESFDVSYSITRLKRINTNTPQWMANNDRSLPPLTQHLEVDLSRPKFEIVGIGRAEVGDTVHKVGRTTGWTTGVVTGVCERLTVNYNEGPVDLFCQDTFEHPRGNVVSGSGDSGSPVFKCVTASGRDDPGCRNSQRVILVGILHSLLGDDDICYEEEGEENCYNSGANFSSADNVLREFNKSFEGEDVCWVLTSTGNCYSPPTQSPQRSNTCQLDTLSMGVRVRGGFGDDCFSVLSDSDYSENARYFNLQLTGDTELQVAVRGVDSATLISADDRNYGEVVGELETGTINAQLPAADYILEVVGREGRSFFVLAADAEQGPLPHEDPILNSIDVACEVFTVPRLRETYNLFWNPECPSDEFANVSQYIKFFVSERMGYRIATNSGSSFADSDSNLIILYDASGDRLKGSSPESDGLFTFNYFSYSSEVIADLNPGTYYVEVVNLEEELFSPVPFEFSIHPVPMPDLSPPDRPQEGTTDNSSSLGNDTLSAIGLLALVTAIVMLVAIVMRLRRGRSRRDDEDYEDYTDRY